MNYKDHFKSNRFTRYDENLTTRYTMAYANLCAIDDETEGYYHDVRNVLEAVNVLGNQRTEYIQPPHVEKDVGKSLMQESGCEKLPQITDLKAASADGESQCIKHFAMNNKKCGDIQNYQANKHLSAAHTLSFILIVTHITAVIQSHKKAFRLKKFF